MGSYRMGIIRLLGPFAILVFLWPVVVVAVLLGYVSQNPTVLVMPLVVLFCYGMAKKDEYRARQKAMLSKDPEERWLAHQRLLRNDKNWTPDAG